MSDPLWSNVRLRLTFDDSDDFLQNYADGPPNSEQSNTGRDTSIVKFGAGAFQLTSTGGLSIKGARYYDSNDASALMLADEDFTIELWVHPLANRNNGHVLGHWGASSEFCYTIVQPSSSGGYVFRYTTDGTLDTVRDISLGSLSLDTWVHLCVDRSGDTIRTYVNGAMVAKITDADEIYTSSSVSLYDRFTVGANGSGQSTFFNGRIDDVRITVGVARYASDLGFIAPTAAYPISGASVVTAEGPVGTFTITPPDGTEVLPTVAEGPVGTFTITPPDGTEVLPTVAEGPVGTFTITPPDGTEVLPTVAEGPVGTFTITPPDVSIVRATTLGLNTLHFADPDDARATTLGLNTLHQTSSNVRITTMGMLVLAKGGEMPLQPNPLSLTDAGRTKVLVQRNVNMYVEPTPEGPGDSARFQRPGLYRVAEMGSGPVRATFLHKGFRFTVSGGSVWRDLENIGEVPNGGPLRWAVSDEEIVLVTGGRAYYVTVHDVSPILDPDLPRVRDVVVLASRFVYFPDDTSGTYYYSALGDARNIDGLSFASAEYRPDPITGAAVQGEGMAIFGTVTTEFHFPTTSAQNPFQRAPGRSYDKGCTCIETVRLADNALFFVGNDRMVYRAAQQPTRVSDFDVDDHLRRQSEDEFNSNSAFVVAYGGHTFYVLNMPGQGTWAYDISQRQWAEWRSWGKDRFRVTVAEEGFMGDYYSGVIMGFDGGRYTDMDDEPIERVVSTFQPLRSGFMRNFNLALHCIQGVGLLPGQHGEDPVVEMRFSDHMGLDWSNWLTAPLGKRAVRTKESLAQWTQLGTFPSPGRVFEFRCTDPVPFSPYMVTINEPRP